MSFHPWLSVNSQVSAFLFFQEMHKYCQTSVFLSSLLLCFFILFKQKPSLIKAIAGFRLKCSAHRVCSGSHYYYLQGAACTKSSAVQYVCVIPNLSVISEKFMFILLDLPLQGTVTFCYKHLLLLGLYLESAVLFLCMIMSLMCNYKHLVSRFYRNEYADEVRMSPRHTSGVFEASSLFLFTQFFSQTAFGSKSFCECLASRDYYCTTQHSIKSLKMLLQQEKKCSGNYVKNLFLLNHFFKVGDKR